ncbi:hypothetical protein ACQKWADRAFT_282165 [Trichoderma austrokoningii]
MHLAREETITAATSAGRWRGGVSFPAAKRRIANSLWLLFVSPLPSARPNTMIQQMIHCQWAITYHQHNGYYLYLVRDITLASYSTGRQRQFV